MICEIVNPNTINFGFVYVNVLINILIDSELIDFLMWNAWNYFLYEYLYQSIVRYFGVLYFPL